MVDVELAHQIDAVSIDRFGIKPEARTDLLGAGSFHQQREYLMLARAQSFERVQRGRFLPGTEYLVKFQRRGNVDAAVENLLEGFE